VGVNITDGMNGFNTIRNLSLIKRSLDKTMRRLSAGEQVSETDDGPAQLMISERMRAQVGTLTQSIKNLEHSANKTQAAGSALDELREQLMAMREVAAAVVEEGTMSDDEVSEYQEQIDILVSGYNRKRDEASYGDARLLDGSADSVAAVSHLGGYDVSSPGKAKEAINKISDTLRSLDSTQVMIGAMAKQEYESTIRSLEVSSQNLVAAESLIRDAEFAAEQADYTRQIIQLNAGVAALAQGNLVSEAVFKLLHM
jgi:flagellin